LHIPTEFTRHAYDLLRQAGEEFGIRDIGYRAIDTLRMEKRYLYWSTDITPDDSPLEAGLGFRVHWEKGNFLGKDALAALKTAGLKRKMMSFVLEQPLSLYGGEALLYNGKIIGVTSSGNHSYTLGKSICYAYVPIELTTKTDGFEIEAFGERSVATKYAGAVYDPKNERLKA